MLHVFNYAWPYVDGYTVRSAGLVRAQRGTLRSETLHAVSPFAPLARGRDECFQPDGWGPTVQRDIPAPTRAGGLDPIDWQRPGIGLAPRSNQHFRRGLRELVADFQPDIVHAHHPHYNARPALAVARELKVPSIYELRCFNGDYDRDKGFSAILRGRRSNALERAACRAADGCVTIGGALADRVRGFGVEPVHIVRNSVDTDLFRPSPGRRTTA